jgi:hypothetical protein
MVTRHVEHGSAFGGQSRTPHERDVSKTTDSGGGRGVVQNAKPARAIDSELDASLQHVDLGYLLSGRVDSSLHPAHPRVSWRLCGSPTPIGSDAEGWAGLSREA